MIDYITFDAKKIALKKIYQSTVLTQSDTNNILCCDKVRDVYGDYIMPKYPTDRPYTMGIFVASVDGRISFKESVDGSLIAKKNFMDPDGGFADFWTLNLIRAASDAVLVSGLMLKRERDLVSIVYDEDLVKQRGIEGKSEMPVQIIISNNGKNIPLDHKVIVNANIPTILAVSQVGLEYLEKNLTVSYKVINIEDKSIGDFKDIMDKYCVFILPVGKEKTNVKDMMSALYKLGIKSISVESPTFMLSLMNEKMLDELYQNTSTIYVGGDALSIGDNFKSFSMEDHPHLGLLSMHIHSDYFFYSRYQMIYGIKNLK